MHQAPTASTPDSLAEVWRRVSPRTAAVDAVYATLREAILSGRLRPGERLAEQVLSRHFEVSRTPVREGLHRLEVEGWAERVPRGGLIVRTISEAEVLEVYSVRIALDGLAASLAATNALPADIAQLRWINQQITEAARAGRTGILTDLSIQFHETLGRAARNGLLLRMLTQVHDWVRRCGETTLVFPKRAPAAEREHEAIIRAVAAHDAETADRLARTHMEHARQIRVKLLRAPDKRAPNASDRGGEAHP